MAYCWLIVFLRIALLLALAPGASAACYKHLTCQACIAEVFTGGSCFWYTNPDRIHPTWSCMAGMIGDNKPSDVAASLLGSTKWPYKSKDGQQAKFTLLSVDAESEDSCYVTPCLKKGVCATGFYAVENKPCYGEGVHPEWRELRCCREQRNIDGYLRGFEVQDGVVRGNLQFSACCMPCNPGSVNKGCDTSNAGTCEACPKGTYNPTGAVGSKCLACAPCPAGFVRVSCGPSREGRCEPCGEDTYKARGLEGLSSDQCLPCDKTCAGKALLGCGGASAGQCADCDGGQFFASPRCRACGACKGSFYARSIGCGARRDSTCTNCMQGKFENVGLGVCEKCASCPSSFSPSYAGALNVSGPLVRIGCGGLARGECVRIAAALGDVAPGQSLSAPLGCKAAGSSSNSSARASCPNAALTLRWAIQGDGHNSSLPPSLASGGGSCSTTNDTCLAGRWHASLLRRTLAAPLGEKVTTLGHWSLKELPSVLSGVVHVKTVTLESLPANLPGSSGYFVRIAFEDHGNTCCASGRSSQLHADTPDFQLAGVATALADEVEAASIELMSSPPQTSSAMARLGAACDRGASLDAAAETLGQEACEKLKRMQLGMAVGDLGLMPLSLPPNGITTMSRAGQAAKPVTEARQALAAWDSLTSIGSALLPSNLMEWRALTRPGANTTPRSLMKLAADAVDAINVTRDTWHSETEASVQQLTRTLKELKELDRLVAESCGAYGFNVIRMAQGATKALWESLKSGRAASGKTMAQWLGTAMDLLGSVAVMLLGTWRHDWRHSIQWRIEADVGSMDSLTTAKPAKAVFGAPSLEGVTPLEQARSRVWTPFREIANAWLARLASEMGGGRRLANTSVTVESKLRKIGHTIGDLITCIETITEELFEPLSRKGASLLRGILPNITVCGPAGRLLHDYAFGEAGAFATAVDVALLGIGPRAFRPWVDTEMELQRLRRGAKEVVELLQGRATLFRTMLLQLLQVRDHASEIREMDSHYVHARRAAAHLSAIVASSSASGPSGVEAAWRWRDICLPLGRILRHGRNSTARLSRLRFGRFQRLVSWAGGVSGADAQWSMTGSASQLLSAKMGAVRALSRALDAAAEAADNSGFLRIEGNAETWPMVFASLEEHGNAMLKLEAPSGSSIRRHREIYAYMLSPDKETLPYPLRSVDRPNEPPLSPAASDKHGIKVPYVELEVRRMAGSVGELVESPVPIFTRHERQSCSPLASDFSPVVTVAMEPLHGLWVIKARDGATKQRLQLDKGTSLRLLIRLDRPSGDPPWQFLSGSRHMLYKTASSGNCNALPMMSSGNGNTAPGQSRGVTTTSTVSLRPGAKERDVITTSSRGAIQRRSTTVSSIYIPQAFLMSEAKPAAPPEQDSDLSPLMWAIPILSAVVLFACIVLAYTRYRYVCCAVCRRIAPCLFGQKHTQVAASDGAFDSPSPKGQDGLRQRLPSPKPGDAPPGSSNPFATPATPDMLRGLALAKDIGPRKLEYAQPKSEVAPAAQLEDWGLGTDTPRRGDESSESGSSSGSSSGDLSDGTGRTWNHAATPPDSPGRAAANPGDAPCSQSAGQGAGSQETVPRSGEAAHRVAGHDTEANPRGPLAQHLHNQELFSSSPPDHQRDQPPSLGSSPPSAGTAAKPSQANDGDSTRNASTNGPDGDGSTISSASDDSRREQLPASEAPYAAPAAPATPLAGADPATLDASPGADSAFGDGELRQAANGEAAGTAAASLDVW